MTPRIAAQALCRILKIPHSKDDPKDPEWRPYIFDREQWHCRICGDRFLYSETVRKHIADAHDENMPRRACTNTSGAQFGSERKFHDLAANTIVEPDIVKLLRAM